MSSGNHFSSARRLLVLLDVAFAKDVSQYGSIHLKTAIVLCTKKTAILK
jgi:hypothetical protein